MISVRGQENLATTHQTAAASKPLNQSIKALQAKTPAPRTRNDENLQFQTAKAQKHIFATPAPRTANRAPLGAKTANVKAQPFQTPAQALKPVTSKLEETVSKRSNARPSAKKKIYVENETSTRFEQAQDEDEEDSEPESGYAPPPIVPLPDPPIDFSEIDQTYSCLKPENFNRGVGEIYFQSPKDENGFSISLKRQEEADKRSLDRDLEHLLHIPAPESLADPGTKSAMRPQVKQSNVNTLRAKSAADALSRTATVRTHQRLPSAATRETTASKSKRKPAFTVAQDSDVRRSVPAPVSKQTIGFPKAKKAASILPASFRQQSQNKPSTSSIAQNPDSESTNSVDVTNMSPQKFLDVHGEPAVGSELWYQLLDLEIKDRHRGDDDVREEGIFDRDLDDKLRLPDGGDDFVLELDD